MKVFIFGSRKIKWVPVEIENFIQQLEASGQQVEYIVGDANGTDAEMQKCLARNGAMSRTTVYCMDFARNNIFKLPTKVFNSADLGEISDIEKYTYKDRQMCEDCDVGIAIWDTKSNGTFANITLLKAKNKPVYVFSVQI